MAISGQPAGKAAYGIGFHPLSCIENLRPFRHPKALVCEIALRERQQPAQAVRGAASVSALRRATARRRKIIDLRVQAIRDRNQLSVRFPSIASPQSSAADWSRRSKMVVGCHTLPIAAPVLKKSAFALMTDPPIPASTTEKGIILVRYYKAL